MALTQATFAGRMLNDAGEALTSKNVYVYDIGTTTQRGTDETNASGNWGITPSGGGPQYDVVMVNGSDKIRWSARDQVMNQTTQIVQPDNEYALTVSHTRDANSVQVAVFEGARATEANEDEAYIDFNLSNNADAQKTIARLAWTIPTIAADSEEGRLEFHIMAAGSLAVQLQLDKTALSPMASDGLALGTAALEWGDLFLADGAVISLGDDQDVTLTHYADNGVLLNSTRKIYFEDGSNYDQSIGSSGSGVTTLASVSGITLDSGADIILDADGADIFLHDGGTLFGTLTNSSGELVLKSSSSGTTAVTFSGANATVAGNLTVSGNFTVNGTTTTVDTTNTVAKDSLIELNNGASSNSNDLGIVMERGSTGDNAIIAWDESADGFTVGTTTATGASTGNLTITAAPFTAAAIVGTTIEASTNFTIGDTVITDGIITDSSGLQLAANLDIDGTADISGDLTLSAGADGALRFTNAGENSIKIPDNQASALIIEEADNAYITFVTTNSSEAITVAKATTFSAGIANAGTIAAGTWNGTAIDGGYINDNIVSGQAEITSGLATADELLYSDGGTVKRVGVDTLTTYLAGVNAGTVTSTGLSDSSGVITLDIQNMTASTTIADADLVVIDDGAGGTLRKMTRANFIGSAAVDLGSNTLTTTGSLQVRTIDYSDGDLAITIADSGLTTFAQTATFGAITATGIINAQRAGSAGGALLELEDTDAAITSGENIGRINWISADDHTDAAGAIARIIVDAEATFSDNNTPTRFRFLTCPALNGADGLVERMRITGAGQVDIKATTASTASTNGALIVGGGIGVAGNSFFATDVDIGSQLAVGNTAIVANTNIASVTNTADGTDVTAGFFRVFANSQTDVTPLLIAVDAEADNATGTGQNTHGDFSSGDGFIGVRSKVTVTGGAGSQVGDAAAFYVKAGALAGGSWDAQYGLYIESLTAATLDYAIYMAGTPLIHAALPAASAATNISLDGSNNLQQDTSSIIFKEEVRDMVEWRSILTDLHPADFVWKSGVNVDAMVGRDDFGFIAQETAAVDRRLATYKDGEPWSVRYMLLTAPLVAGWQEHDQRLDEIERKLKDTGEV